MPQRTSKKLPKFPSLAERQSIMEELKKAQDEGKGVAASEHYKNYIDQLTQLNAIMDQYSVIDEQFGLPPTLDQKGKQSILEAMEKTAKAGETFLADAKNKDANLKAGIPGIVGRIQGMLAQDFETLELYDPGKNPMSFPELQQQSRTQVVDFRGQKIGIMTNKLSGRLPMTVVDAKGKRRRGFFTKASYVSIKKPFEKLIEDATAYYDRPEVKKTFSVYKNALIKKGHFPGVPPEQITDDMVGEKLKEPIRNILPKYREYMAKLKKKDEKTLPGIDPMKSPDEQILGYFYNQIMSGKDPKAVLRKIGIDHTLIAEDVHDILLDGFQKAVKENLSDTVNARDLGLKDGDRVDQRNSAMSAMAGLLGMSSLCARSTNMKYLDEEGKEVEGTFMEFAEGLDLMHPGNEKLFRHVAEDPFESPCKANTSLADLQILDYLSGNVDRHGGNMSYKVDENGKFVGIQAFDNDTSFGVLPIDKEKGNFRLAGVEQLKVITAPMAKKISNISPEMLKFSLRGRGLTEEEIEASCKRLTDLQQAIAKGKKAESIADLASSGKQLCIFEPEALQKIPFNALAANKNTVFENVRNDINRQMEAARGMGYSYDPNAPKPEEKQLTEVSTTDRRFSAGGISASMSEMDLMLKNEVTGFEVGGLSKLFRSSSKWRSMVAAVKAASKAAKEINQQISKDKEYLTRDDPRVQDQVKLANRAMETVKKANQDYLDRKMKEKGVKNPEDLLGKGKHDYEENRIKYALKLRDSVKAYEEILNPQSQKAKEQKEAVTQSLSFANKRREQPQPQPQLGA